MQQNAAISERDNALLECDNAIAALRSLESVVSIPRGTKCMDHLQVMQLMELEVFISTRKVYGSHSIEKVIAKDDRPVSSAERYPNSF